MMSELRLWILAIFFISCVLSGCGGGGGSTSSSPDSNSSSSSSASTSLNLASNQILITVDSGATGSSFNRPFVSVTLCAPGTTNLCQTVDHVLLDTGSAGLRLFADALSTSLTSALTQASVNGQSLVECMQYASGHSWGPIKQADITIGNYTLSDVSVQIVGDSSFSSVPSRCSSIGSALDTTSHTGFKGVLGINPALYDCGTSCALSATTLYYACSTSSNCQTTAVPLTEQIHNPVSLFSTDNNGILIQLPALSSHMASSAQGTLTFGIGTASNNALGNATVLKLVDNSFSLNTKMQGFTYTYTVFDTGTPIWYFDDNGNMSLCSSNQSYYCPGTLQTIAATFQDSNNTSASMSFNVGNAISELNTTNKAFDDLAGPANDTVSHKTFIVGFPFFYGKSFWMALDNTTISGETGPFIAFQ